MKGLITFYKDGKPVCSTIEIAKNEEELGLMAEFNLISFFPNVAYDNYRVEVLEDD